MRVEGQGFFERGLEVATRSVTIGTANDDQATTEVTDVDLEGFHPGFGEAGGRHIDENDAGVIEKGLRANGQAVGAGEIDAQPLFFERLKEILRVFVGGGDKEDFRWTDDTAEGRQPVVLKETIVAERVNLHAEIAEAGIARLKRKGAVVRAGTEVGLFAVDDRAGCKDGDGGGRWRFGSDGQAEVEGLPRADGRRDAHVAQFDFGCGWAADFDIADFDTGGGGAAGNDFPIANRGFAVAEDDHTFGGIGREECQPQADGFFKVGIALRGCGT